VSGQAAVAGITLLAINGAILILRYRLSFSRPPEKAQLRWLSAISDEQGAGAGSGNRTRITSLEGWGFTTKLYPRFSGAAMRSRLAIKTGPPSISLRPGGGFGSLITCREMAASLHRVSTVHRQYLAGDEAAGVRSEVEQREGDVRELAEDT
jgi:hypothetical protein